MSEKKMRGDVGHIRIGLQKYNFNTVVKNTNINSQTNDKTASTA